MNVVVRLELLNTVAWEGDPVGGGRTHTLLRTLADHGRRGASEAALIEAIWPDETPANPHKSLQVVVARARAATAAEVIERVPHGYRIALPDEEVDLWAARPEGLRLATEGRYAEALPLLERAEADDRVTEALLRAVADVEGVPKALARYETYRADLAERQGVDPAPALQRLHRELLARDRPVRSGLRYDATELIGRDADLSALTALCRTGRLTSIVGPGGLGKTRLANLLARVAEEPVVHVVELVGVSSPEDVVGEIGSALAVRESVQRRRDLTPQQRADIRTRIAERLSGATTLLVLDNCEHVIDAVADLVGYLIASCPDLHVLTTSRAPLRVGGEQVYELAQLADADGVRLFRTRAAAARPGAELPDAPVREIVNRLDGVPLAIELAAAKVRVMSPVDIARRLGDRFALLRGGDRSAPDRHQTLLAVIDWSWNLLDETERRALRRLAVFQDGFTLDAAEHMLGADALSTVGRLADHSLLTVIDTSAGVRYRMLETVREFGRLRLIEAGGQEEALDDQRTWAVEFATTQAERLFTRDQIEASDALAAEDTNLTDALRRALVEPDPTTAVQLFAALGGLWTIRGEHARNLSLLGALDDAVSDWTPPPEHVDATRIAVYLAMFNDIIALGMRTTALRGLLRRLGWESDRPAVRAIGRVVSALLGEPDGSVDPGDLIDDPDRWTQIVARLWRGHERENSGYPQEAIEQHEKILELIDDEHGPWMRAVQHAQLSGLYAQSGSPTQGAEHARRALPVLRRLGADDDLSQLSGVLILAALDEGRVEEASEIVEDIATGLRDPDFASRGVLLSSRADVAFARGDVAGGLAALRDAVTAIKRRPTPFTRTGEQSFAPWVVSGEAAAVVAHAWYSDGGDDLYDDLVRRVVDGVTERGGHVDFPVLGTVLFATGVWGLQREVTPPPLAVRLLVLAERFSYARFSTTMRWDRAEELAEKVAPGLLAQVQASYGERRGPDLLDEARDVVLQTFRE